MLRVSYRVLFIAFLAIAMFVVTTSVWAMGRTSPPLAADEATAQTIDGIDMAGGNCRYGVAAFGNQAEWVSTLGAGWWIDFSVATSYTDVPSEFAHVVRVRPFSISPNESDLRQYVSQSPGSLWIVGNEIDREGQDGVTPERYARAYHEVYNLIKEEDATAQIAISALVQVTPLRLLYLDLVMDSYQKQFGSAMPVEVWNMHLYVLPELNPDGSVNEIASVPVGVAEYLQTVPNLSLTDLGKFGSGGVMQPGCNNPNDQLYCYSEHDDMTIFATQVRDMRRWMAENGQRHKPLILSEFSLLYPYEDDGNSCFLADETGQCFDPPRVLDFLETSFDYLYTARDANLGMPTDDNRLVQQSLWFSTNVTGAGSASNLLKDNYSDFTPGSAAALNSIGTAMKQEITSRSANVNLVATDAANVIGRTQGGAATVTLPVSFRNNGNRVITQSFQVSFFRGQYPNNQGLIGSTTVSADAAGCARTLYQASVPWAGLGPGVYDYWVRIDSSDQINETTNNDNIAQGRVLIDPDTTLNLPVVTRR